MDYTFYIFVKNKQDLAAFRSNWSNSVISSGISEILPQKCNCKEGLVFCYVSSITNALCDVLEFFFSPSLCFKCIWTPEIGLSFGSELLYIGFAL